MRSYLVKQKTPLSILSAGAGLIEKVNADESDSPYSGSLNLNGFR